MTENCIDVFLLLIYLRIFINIQANFQEIILILSFILNGAKWLILSYINRQEKIDMKTTLFIKMGKTFIYY